MNRLALKNKGKFEEERKYSIWKHHVYGMTVKDKFYFENKSERTHYSESTEAKIFIEFVARIVINRIYTKLKEETESFIESPNYMTVSAALREFEKIEMILGHDQIYRLNHAVTKTQKTILNAFGMDTAYLKRRANRFSEQLKIAVHMGAHNVQ